MNERIENELKGLANKLGKSEEEMLAKVNEIAESNKKLCKKQFENFLF